jgi:hypothetical protein
MKRFSVFLTLFIAFALLSSSAFSQNQNQSQNQNNGLSAGLNGFWEIDCPGGKFVARLDHITSVSQHSYVIDGAVTVFECTVSTSGGLIGRFYHIEPVGAGSSTVSGSNTYNRLKGLANRATDRAGMGDSEHLVTKHYPDTTHAKTSEYRFKYKDTIGRIYNHAHRVWAQERGRGKENKITIRE